jgi:MFS family permease
VLENNSATSSVSGRRYKTYLLVVLMFILAFNFVDRLALGLVLENIKTDLHLSDTQLGLMSGIAFALFYSVMGIPIARWADRGNRITIISLTVALWSIMVVGCGFARSFLQLLLIRIGVAVGQAGCAPTSFSLISDHFTRAERPAASAIYTLGGPLSFLLGYFPAGWLNEAYGWRVTFMVLGLPGLALAAVAALTLKEPRFPRPNSFAANAVPAFAAKPCQSVTDSIRQPSLKEVCAALWKVPTFRHLLLCYSVLELFTSGILQWQPTFFLRSYGLKTGELGTWFAIIYGVGGILGTYWGGQLASRGGARNERLQLKASALVYVVLGFVSTAIYITHSYHLAFLELTAFAIGMFSISGPLWATIQTVVPEKMRATAIALIYLVANLIGAGCGPLAVGALSDAMVPWAGEESLRYALLAVSPGLLWGAWHLWRSSTTVTEDIEAVLRNQPVRNAAPTLCPSIHI